MKKKVFKGVLLAFASCMLMFSNVASAAVRTNFDSAVSGDIIVFPGNSTRYVYVGPDSSGASVRVSPGMGIVGYIVNPALISAGADQTAESGSYFAYISSLLPGSIYANYLADGAATSNSAKVTALTALQESQVVVNNTLDRLNSVLTGSQSTALQVAWGTGDENSGVATGDDDVAFGLWAQGNWSHIQNDDVTSKFKGNAWGGTVGVDATVHGAATVGLSVTYTRIGDGETEFNKGTFEHNTYTVSPYFAVKLHENFGLEGVLGFSRADKDFTRTPTYFVNNVAFFDDAAEKITGSTHSDRVFSAAYLHGWHSVDEFNMALRVGYFYVMDIQSEFTDSVGVVNAKTSNQMGTVNGRVRLGYQVNKCVEPYVVAGVENHSKLTKLTFVDGTQPKYNDTGWMAGLGVNMWNHENNLTGNVEANYSAHGDLKVTSALAKVRYMF